MLPHTLVVEEFASLGATDLVHSKNALYIHKHKAPGYSSSINIGIGYALDHDYSHIVTINNDIELTSRILPQFMRGFRYADIVGGTLWYPSGRLQSASWSYREDCMPIETEKYLHFNSASRYKDERFVGGITGALQGFDLTLGYYDEDYLLSYEDVDFCVRALMNDKKILYTPSISAVHVESSTRGNFLGQAELQSFNLYKKRLDEWNITGGELNLKVEEQNKL